MSRIEPARVKTCKVCGGDYRPFNTTQQVCSSRCAYTFEVKRQEKREQRQAEKKRAADSFLNDRQHMLKTTQEAFNAYIRHRDAGLPCISCGEKIKGYGHAGHYRGIGSQPALRFNPWNVHLQCFDCNNVKSGNPKEYRRNLIKRVGLDIVEYLEKEHQERKYTVLHLAALRKYFKQRAK